MSKRSCIEQDVKAEWLAKKKRDRERLQVTRKKAKEKAAALIEKIRTYSNWLVQLGITGQINSGLLHSLYSIGGSALLKVERSKLNSAGLQLDVGYGVFNRGWRILIGMVIAVYYGKETKLEKGDLKKLKAANKAYYLRYRHNGNIVLDGTPPDVRQDGDTLGCYVQRVCSPKKCKYVGLQDLTIVNCVSCKEVTELAFITPAHEKTCYMYLKATRDIEVGEELLTNYGSGYSVQTVPIDD
jgi:hypothetical protein